MSKRFNLNLISKYRNAIYGFSIFYITLFHARAINQVDWSFGHEWLKIFKTVMDNGNIGVDSFLFLSGISLCYSFSKDSNVIRFLKKRIRRIWMPVLLVCGWYWLMLFASDHDAGNLISRLLMIRFWQTGDQSIWFVSLILVLYLAYPLLYHFIFKTPKKTGIAVRTLLLMGITYILLVLYAGANPDSFKLFEIAITRIPVFILGCGCGRLIYEGKEVNKLWAALPVLMLVFYIGVVHNNLIQSYPRRFFCLIGGLGLAYSLTLLFDLLTKHGQRKSLITNAFSKLGEFSLEIYLSTGVFNQLLRKWDGYEMGTLPLYLVMLLVAYLFAYVVYRIEKVINRKIEERKCLQA